jgi:hypothetical protein
MHYDGWQVSWPTEQEIRDTETGHIVMVTGGAPKRSRNSSRSIRAIGIHGSLVALRRRNIGACRSSCGRYGR